MMPLLIPLRRRPTGLQRTARIHRRKSASKCRGRRFFHFDSRASDWPELPRPFGSGNRAGRKHRRDERGSHESQERCKAWQLDDLCRRAAAAARGSGAQAWRQPWRAIISDPAGRSGPPLFFTSHTRRKSKCCCSPGCNRKGSRSITPLD